MNRVCSIVRGHGGWVHAVALGLSCTTAPFVRAEITASPAAEFRTGYDSNPAFLAQDVRARARIEARGEVGLGFTEPSRRIDLNVRGRHVETIDDPLTSGSSYGGTVRWSRQFERQRLSLSSDYDDLAIAVSELNELGELESDQRRQDLRGNLDWSFELTPRATVSTGAGVTWSRIVNDLGSGFVDYDFASAGSSFQYAWSERTLLGVSGTYTLFTAKNDPVARQIAGDDRTRTVTVEGSLRHELSERISVRASAGARRSTIDAVAELVPGLLYRRIETENDGFVAGVGGRLTAERWELDLDYRRDLQPTVVGLVVERDTVDGFLRIDLDRNTELLANLSFLISDNIQGVPSVINRERTALGLGLRRRLSERWTASVRVDWIGQSFAGDSPLTASDDPRNQLLAALRVRYAVQDAPLGL